MKLYIGNPKVLDPHKELKIRSAIAADQMTWVAQFSEYENNKKIQNKKGKGSALAY